LPGPKSRKAVEVAEEFAEGGVSQERLAAAGRAALREGDPVEEYNAGYWATEADIGVMLVKALWCPEMLAGWSAYRCSRDQVKVQAAYKCIRVKQALLLRDIFGNPFRPIAINPAWQTPTVVALAHAAYEERLLPSGELNQLRLAVLAEVLEEAGAGGELMEHLRGPGLHVRGCHVIDLLTGRT
jgi:hypothetical protein